MSDEPKPTLADRARALAETIDRATPGPWTTEKPGRDADGWSTGTTILCAGRGQCVYATPPGGVYPSSDLSMAIAARNEAPALLRELAKEIEELRAENERWSSDYDAVCLDLMLFEGREE